jgi:plasmid stability protein
MARKKEIKPMVATEPKLQAVRLELAPEIHLQLRVIAAQHGKSMAAYVRELVIQDLARKKGGGK